MSKTWWDVTTGYLNERDPQCPARPQTFIGPDLVGELDVLDCDVVPAIVDIKHRGSQTRLAPPDGEPGQRLPLHHRVVGKGGPAGAA